LAGRTRIASNTGVTRYLQLYTMLSQALADGRIGPGSALPSEPELVREYHVSRTTVRRALARLENEDRIVRRRGSGTYARMAAPHETLRFDQSTLLADLRFLTSRTKSRLIDSERVPTPEFVRRHSPEFGSVALRVRSVREFNREPLMLAVGYVPERLSNKLNKRQLAKKALVMCLQEIGARPSSGEQLISAVGADSFAARHLKVDVSAPLLHTRQIVRDAQGRAVTLEEVYCRPERYEYRMQVEVR
jgi:GntR family transcriptional regulator